MNLLFFLYTYNIPFWTNAPVYILGIGTLILLTLTLSLLSVALIIRWQHHLYEQRLENIKDDLYPLILEFLEDDVSLSRIKEKLSDGKKEIVAFKQIIFGLLNNVKGKDAEKLRKLLRLTPVYQYHFDLLSAYSLHKKLNGYNYFSYLDVDDPKVIKVAEKDLNHSRQILVYAAASALLEAREVEVRGRALEALSRRPSLSRMALLDALYKFHNDEWYEMEQETEFLRPLVELHDLPDKNRSIIIRGISEIGYETFVPVFFKKLKSGNPNGNRPMVISALIEALGRFYVVEASPYIREYIYHPSLSIRKSCVEALGNLTTEENLKALFNMVFDEKIEIRKKAVEKLRKAGESGEAWLQKARIIEKESPFLTLNIQSIITRIDT